MIIIGAGMAGLIAARYFKDYEPTVWEAQKSLPNNHEALLRFRTDKASKLTGIAFKKAHVRKAIFCNGVYADRCNPYLANMYSRKVTDEVQGRSIWNLDPVDRYVAPGNFIFGMALDARVSYSTLVDDLDIFKSKGQPVISTIPMPSLMRMAGWKDVPKFRWKPIWSIQAEIIEPKINVYQTIYYPGTEPYYRASITGNRLIVECNSEPDNVGQILLQVAQEFGIWPTAFSEEPIPKYQEYGKIISGDPQVCQDFVFSMTQEYGIYSLGRFATWRQLLLDDIIEDCHVIERLIRSEARRSGYQESLRRVRASISHS